MSASPGSESVRQFVAELNEGNLDSINRYAAADYFNHSPQGDEPKANEVYFDILSDIKAAMPDLHFELADLSSNGEVMTAVLTVTGTTTGPLWGAPPTNKAFS